MTNAEVIISCLLDALEDDGKQFERVFIDDGGATEESVIYYNIACPPQGKCKNGEKPCRKICSECKYAWLLSEYDEE